MQFGSTMNEVLDFIFGLLDDLIHDFVVVSLFPFSLLLILISRLSKCTVSPS